MTGGGTAIRPATPEDHEAIWRILEPVYRAGETYCIPPDITRDEALADWFAAPFTAFVAEADGRVLGTSHVGRNRPGPAAHVANASFATHPDARGRASPARWSPTPRTGRGRRASGPCSSISSSRPMPMPFIRGKRPVSILSAACRARFFIRNMAMSMRWSCSTT